MRFRVWNADSFIRDGSSPRGAVTESSKWFVENGGEVFTCCFEEGTFCILR